MPVPTGIFLSSIKPHPLLQEISKYKKAASKGGLFDDSRTLSKLIGRPTTTLAESIKAIL